MMSRTSTIINDRRTLRAVTPGGITRQFRVQFRLQTTEGWRMYGSFLCADEAQACAERLNSRGVETRILKHCVCAAAA